MEGIDRCYRGREEMEDKPKGQERFCRHTHQAEQIDPRCLLVACCCWLYVPHTQPHMLTEYRVRCTEGADRCTEVQSTHGSIIFGRT